MSANHLIEVGYKEGVVDPVGQGLERTISHLGLVKAKRVTAAQLYRVAGDLSAADKTRIGRELLCDPVTQEFSDAAISKKTKGGPLVIDVWYKAGVTDVVGESVAKGIQDLDVSGVESVRAGMRYRVWGLPNKAAAEKLALALLANPLVQDQIIHAD